MRPRTFQLVKQLQDEDVLQDLADLMLSRYYDEWLLAEDVEVREKIHIKTQMVDEILVEFSTILDNNRETEK